MSELARRAMRWRDSPVHLSFVLVGERDRSHELKSLDVCHSRQRAGIMDGREEAARTDGAQEVKVKQPARNLRAVAVR